MMVFKDGEQTVISMYPTEFLLSHNWTLFNVKADNITLENFKIGSSRFKGQKIEADKTEYEMYNSPFIGRLVQTYNALRFIWLES